MKRKLLVFFRLFSIFLVLVAIGVSTYVGIKNLNENNDNLIDSSEEEDDGFLDITEGSEDLEDYEDEEDEEVIYETNATLSSLPSTVTSVSTASSLYNYLTTKASRNIKLTANITINDSYFANDNIGRYGMTLNNLVEGEDTSFYGYTYCIDLNGYTLTLTSSSSASVIVGTASLTIKNGTLKTTRVRFSVGDNFCLGSTYNDSLSSFYLQDVSWTHYSSTLALYSHQSVHIISMVNSSLTCSYHTNLVRLNGYRRVDGLAHFTMMGSSIYGINGSSYLENSSSIVYIYRNCNLLMDNSSIRNNLSVSSTYYCSLVLGLEGGTVNLYNSELVSPNQCVVGNEQPIDNHPSIRYKSDLELYMKDSKVTGITSEIQGNSDLIASLYGTSYLDVANTMTTSGFQEYNVYGELSEVRFYNIRAYANIKLNIDNGMVFLGVNNPFYLELDMSGGELFPISPGVVKLNSSNTDLDILEIKQLDILPINNFNVSGGSIYGSLQLKTATASLGSTPYKDSKLTERLDINFSGGEHYYYTTDTSISESFINIIGDLNLNITGGIYHNDSTCYFYSADTGGNVYAYPRQSLFELREGRGYYPSLNITGGTFYHKAYGDMIDITRYNPATTSDDACLSNITIDITGGSFYTNGKLFKQVYSDENVNISNAYFEGEGLYTCFWDSSEGDITFTNCEFVKGNFRDNGGSSNLYLIDCIAPLLYVSNKGRIHIGGTTFGSSTVKSYYLYIEGSGATPGVLNIDGNVSLLDGCEISFYYVDLVINDNCSLSSDNFGLGDFTFYENCSISGYIYSGPSCNFTLYNNGNLTLKDGTFIDSCFKGIYADGNVIIEGDVEFDCSGGDIYTDGGSASNFTPIDATGYTGTDYIYIEGCSAIAFCEKVKVVEGTTSNISYFRYYNAGFKFEYSNGDAYIVLEPHSSMISANIDTTYDKTAKTLTAEWSHVFHDFSYTYQWYTASGTKLGTTNTLSFTNVQAKTYYYCVITASFQSFPTVSVSTAQRYVLINKRTLSLTWDNTSFTYDGASHIPTVTRGNVVSGDTVTVGVSGAQTNAGTYTATASITAGSANYKLPTTYTKSFTINKADLSVTANAHSITYGSSPSNNGVTYSGFVNGQTSSVLTGTLKYAYNYSQYGAVGEYVITPSGLSSSNYNISFITGKLTVNKKTIGISWTNTSLVYNGAAQTPTATATGLLNSDKCSITVTGGQKNVGTGYTATASTLSNANYALPSSKTTTYAITKAALTIKCTPISGTFTYDGSPAEYSGSYTVAAVSGLKGSDAVGVAAIAGTAVYKFSSDSYTSSTTAPTNAGTYTISLSGLSATAANYTVTVTFGTNTLKINKAAITPSVSVEDFTYAATLPQPVVTGNLGNASYSIYYYVSTSSSSTKVLWDSTTTSKSFDATKYNLYVVVNESSNYSAATSEISTFTVEAASFVVSLSMPGYTYAGSVSTPSVLGNLSNGAETVYFSTSSSKETGTWNVWSNIGAKTLDAGTYYMYVTVDALSPYKASESAVIQFKIAKATVTPILSMNGYTYGGSVSTPSVTGQLENPEITYYYSTSSTGTGTEWANIEGNTLNAGTYYMYAIVDATTNYNTVTTEAVEFKIAKAQGSITLSKTTGTITFPNNDSLLVSSYVGDGSLSVTTTSSIATATLSANTITIIPSSIGSVTFTVQCLEGTNYYGSTATYQLTINPGTIASSAYSVTYYNSQYDGLFHSINVSCSLSGATITYSDSETGTYTQNISDYSYKNVTNGNVKVYFKISLPNYNDVVASSTVTITPRKVNATVTPTNYEVTYTGQAIPFNSMYTVTYDRIIEGDVISVNDANVVYTYSGSESAPINVNTYVIGMTGLVATNNNYEVTMSYNTGSMIIKKLMVEIPTALDKVLTYDGEEHEYLPSGFNSTHCNITNNVYKNASVYSAIVELKDTTNTMWTDATYDARNFDFVVYKKDISITVTVNSSQQVYNGAVNYVKGYTITSNTELGINDTIDNIFTTSGTLVYKANGGEFVSDVGVYEVTLEGLVLTSSNYNVTTRNNVNGTYTITNAKLSNIKYSSDLTKTYDGTPLEVYVSVSPVKDEEVTYEYIVSPSLTNAGTLNVKCVASAINHDDLEITYTITVNKKDVTIIVTPGAQDSVYTGSLSYENMDKYYVSEVNTLVEVDLNNVENNDYSNIITLTGTPSFTFAGSTVVPQNVGSYEIRMSGLQATSNNYNITTINYGSAFFNIEEATMDVTTVDYAGTYDGEYHNGSIEATTFGEQETVIYYSTVSQVQANTKTDTVAPTFKDVRLVDGVVSAYTVYYLVSAPNHYDVEGSYTVLINQAVLTITVTPNDYTATYSNQLVYPGNYSITSINGLISPDSQEVVTFTGTPLFKYGNDEDGYSTVMPQNFGSYKVTIENLVASSNNYKISTTFAKANLVIEKKNLRDAVATLTSTSIIYNGSEQKLTPTVNINLVDGQENVLLLDNTDYELSYSNAVDVGEVVITISGLGNYTGTTTISYHIIAADASGLAPDLAAIDVKILTISNNVARLTYYSDLDLSTCKNEYGQWVVDTTVHTQLDSPIYTVSGKKSYEVAMVFNAVNANYSGTTGMLTVNLVKNSLEFDTFNNVITTYDKEEIETPNLGIKYFNPDYNGTPAVQYYKDGKAIDYVPTNAGEYQYKVICAETMYYQYNESELVNITIERKNITTDLEFSSVEDQTYTGEQITPVVTVNYGEYQLTADDIELIYVNNIDSTIKSGSKATVYVTGIGNYTGVYDQITFTINPKSLLESMVGQLGSYEYIETGVEPTIVVTDNERAKTLLNDVNGDYTVAYSNNTSITTEAVATITGVNNYTGTITVNYEITKGTIASDKVPTLGILSASVDSLVTSLLAQLEVYNNEYGSWVFWDNENNTTYSETMVVATSVGNGMTTLGAKFIPDDTNYNEVLGKTVSIIISLNDSSVEFKNNNIEFIYDSYQVEFTAADINKLNSSGELYEDEFTNDRVTFNFYTLEDASITTPINVGTYKVEVVVSSNRKYREASATTTFTITPRNIAEVEFAYLDADSNTSDYQYRAIDIKPIINATYGQDTLNTKYTDYTVMGYNNIRDISTDGNNATIIISGSGNYSGTTTIAFNIVKRELSTLTVADISEQLFSGAEIKPDVTIFNNGVLLTTNDITLEYSNNINVGMATITINAKEDSNYNGSITTTFVITNKPIDSALLPEIVNLIAVVGTKLIDLELPSNSYGSWTFVMLKTDSEATVGQVSQTGNKFELEFVPTDSSYSSVYDSVTIIVTKMTSTINITSTSLDKEYNTLADSTPLYEYDGDQTAIDISYYQNGVKLTESPKNAGNYTVVITAAATDMYEAATAQMNFTISKAVIGSINVVVSEIEAQKYEDGNKIVPELEIIHTFTSGTYKLVYNTDYAVVSDANNTIGTNAGTLYILGMNNYTTTDAFLTVQFDIFENNENLDPEGTTVNITMEAIASQEYTGSAITPQVTVLANGLELDTQYYTVEYSNNINVTTQAIAKVTLCNGYSGELSKSFTITAHTLDPSYVTVTDITIGSTPTVTVAINGTELVKDTDYTTLVTGNNTVVGSGTVEVYGKGNYTGTVTKTYNIGNEEPTYLQLNNSTFEYKAIEKSGRTTKWVTKTHTVAGEFDLYLFNVAPNQMIAPLLTQFNNSIDRLKVVNVNGDVIESSLYSSSYITSGTKIELYDASGSLIEYLTVIIVGDANYDGVVNIRDRMIYSTKFGLTTSTDILATYTCDLNLDRSVGSTDLDTLVGYMSSSHPHICNLIV